MNKKGFTLMEVLTVIIVITAIMMIALPTISNISKKNNNELYKTYEKIIEEYALTNEHKGEIVINIDQLGLREKIGDKCNGYAYLINDRPLEYKAYILCGDYRTTGYEEGMSSGK